MRTFAIVIFGALLAVGAACSSPDAPVSSDDLPVGDQPATDDPIDGSMVALPPERTMHNDVENLRPRPFESGLHDETDDSFHVLFWSGREPCYALGRVDVVETSDAITVTLSEGNFRDDDVACTDDAQHVSVPITLQRPVGDRILVDGASGQEVVINFIRRGAAAAQ